MEQQNPIPSRIRGRILVAAIIVGGAVGPVLIALNGLGAPAWVLATVGSVQASVSTVAAALSRANLTLDKVPGDE